MKIQKKIIEAFLVSSSISAIGFLGESFTHFTPLRLYLSATALDQIFIRFFVWFCVTSVLLLPLVHFSFNTQRVLARKILTGALGGIFTYLFISGLLKIADIRTEEVVGHTLGIKNDAAWAAFFVITFIAVSFAKNFPETSLKKFIDLSKVVALTFFCLLAYRSYISGFPVIHTNIAEQVAKFKNQKRSEVQFDRRVVFVVFDEFDPTVAFKDEEKLQKFLPNFKNLIDKSYFSPNALPPAKATAESIPAMLMGKPTIGNFLTGDGTLRVATSPNEAIQFAEENTLLKALPGGPEALSIMGFYHPYCKIFSTSKCISFLYHNLPGNPLEIKTLIPRAMTGEIRNSFKLLAETTKHQIELIPHFLKDRSSQFIYLHFNIPHLEAHYAADFLNEPLKKTADDSYFQNLRLSDAVLGKILSVLANDSKNNDQVMLIICSDHWFRSSKNKLDDSKGLPALMIVNLSGEKSKLLNSKKISTHHLTELALSYLKGEMNSYKEIEHWYSLKPIFQTYIGGSKWAN